MKPTLTIFALPAIALSLSSCATWVDEMSIRMDETTIVEPDIDEIEEIEARESGFFPDEAVPASEKTIIDPATGRSITVPAEQAEAAAAAAAAQGGQVPGAGNANIPVPPAPQTNTPVPPPPTAPTVPKTQFYDPALIRELQ